MSRKSAALYALLLSVVFSALGFWFGLRHQAKASVIAQFHEQTFFHLNEARHDGDLLRLLKMKKDADVQNLAQFRYYSRILLLDESIEGVSDAGLKSQIRTAITDAKGYLKENPYSSPDVETNKKLQELLRR